MDRGALSRAFEEFCAGEIERVERGVKYYVGLIEDRKAKLPDRGELARELDQADLSEWTNRVAAEATQNVQGAYRFMVHCYEPTGLIDYDLFSLAEDAKNDAIDKIESMRKSQRGEGPCSVRV